MKLLFILLLLHVTLFAKIGTISALNGEVNINRESKTLNAQLGHAIELKDSIVTAKDAKVQIIMMDETVITIGSNSIYNFEEYGNDHASMKIEKGFFRAITGKIGKIAPEKFKIKTQSATIGIRGTHFSGLIQKNSEVIKCIRGKITITTAKKVYEVPHGMMITLANNRWKKEAIQLESSPKKVETPVSEAKVNVQKQNINVQEIEKLGTKAKINVIVPNDVPSFNPE